MADVNKTVAINYSASTENLEKALKKIPDITDQQASKAASELDKNFKKMEDGAERTSKSVSHKMKNVGKSMAAVGAAMGGLAIGTIALSQKFADLTNELVDASSKSGIAVETLAGLRLAAEGAGLEFGGLADSLNQFQVQIMDAAAGAGNVALFEQLGVDVKTANGELRASNDVFGDTIKALGKMDNEVQRNSIALKLLGEAGGAGLIQSGALENLEAMSNLATEFGVSLSQDGVNAMGTFQRKMAELELVGMGALQSLINSVAGANGINAAIEGTSKAIVFMGSIGEDIIGLIGQSFENIFGIVQAGIMAMSGDFEQASILMNDIMNENEKAVFDLANMFTKANEQVAKFESLSSASTAPKVMEKVKVQTSKSKEEMEALAKATENAKKELEAINDMINTTHDTVKDLTDTVSENMLSAYQKQRAEIMETSKAIEDQLTNLESQKEIIELQMEMSEDTLEFELQMNQLVNDQAKLRKALSDQRKIEIKEIQELEREAYLERVEQVGEIGSKAFETFGNISSIVTDMWSAQADSLSNQMMDQQSKIDEMVENGVLTSEQAAAKKEQIEAKYQAQIQDFKMKEYKLNQTSALASIAFDLAKGIAAAMILPPLARGAQIAFLTATAGAQSASVLAAPPPKFDVGGMVGNNDRAPDMVNANLLKGEAVLDRATVDRIGGEEGVRNLQNGGSNGSQVVIIQPFKHLDRYNMARSKRMSKRVGSRGY